MNPHSTSSTSSWQCAVLHTLPDNMLVILGSLSHVAFSDQVVPIVLSVYSASTHVQLCPVMISNISPDIL